MEPISDTKGVPNHSSAQEFPVEVGDFIRKELSHGALVGPFLAPPFDPWAHVAPIMSRPKADSSKRRIITDLTFPEEKSINAFIFKNSIMGEPREHSLPTVSDFVDDLKQMGAGSYMFTVDLDRAYKNFRADPLDWPLMCLKWDGSFYVETAMPFGARSSSANMQRAANVITRILGKEGVCVRMYLDDLIAVARTKEEADRQYARVQQLFTELGLPEAKGKAQPPATRVRWLGIDISSADMTLSIPQDKLSEVLLVVDRCIGKRTIHRRQYESLIGKLMHIAKCVAPARVFMSRLLQALREAQGMFVKVDSQVKADLTWFQEFAREWNGVAIIHEGDPDMFVQVDACLTGIGGTDGERAYSGRVADLDDPARSITDLEAVNVIIALHTFLDSSHRGATSWWNATTSRRSRRYSGGGREAASWLSVPGCRGCSKPSWTLRLRLRILQVKTMARLTPSAGPTCLQEIEGSPQRRYMPKASG